MKGPPERLPAAEAASSGNDLEPDRRSLELAASGLDSDLLDEPGRCLAELGAEQPREMPGRQADPSGEAGDAVVARWIGLDQFLSPSDRLDS